MMEREASMQATADVRIPWDDCPERGWHMVDLSPFDDSSVRNGCQWPTWLTYPHMRLTWVFVGVVEGGAKCRGIDESALPVVMR